MKYLTNLGTICSAKTTTGVGNTINVEGYEQIIFEVATTGAPTATIKFKGSVSDAAPTFSSATSSTNLWEYLAFSKVDATSAVAGSTGLTSTTTDIVTIVSVSVPHVKYVTADITALSAGTSPTVTIKVIGVKTKYV